MDKDLPDEMDDGLLDELAEELDEQARGQDRSMRIARPGAGDAVIQARRACAGARLAFADAREAQPHTAALLSRLRESWGIGPR